MPKTAFPTATFSRLNFASVQPARSQCPKRPFPLQREGSDSCRFYNEVSMPKRPFALQPRCRTASISISESLNAQNGLSHCNSEPLAWHVKPWSPSVRSLNAQNGLSHCNTVGMSQMKRSDRESLNAQNGLSHCNATAVVLKP